MFKGNHMFMPGKVMFKGNFHKIERFSTLRYEHFDITSISKISDRKNDSPNFWLIFLARDQNNLLITVDDLISDTIIKVILGT